MIEIYEDYIIFINNKNQFHRVDGPAVIYYSGTKFWYKNSQLHREDGPAVIYHDGAKSWFINGIEYSEKDYYIKLKKMDI